MTFSCQKNLNKNIGVSISEINGTFDNGFENIHLYTAQEEISKYLLYTKNKIVYGGDISYKSEFNFVKILAEIADSYGNRDVPIINHVCYPLDKNIDINIKAKYKTIIEFKEFNELEVNHDDEIMPYSHLESLISFSKNLSLMRKMMAKNTDARIMLGGKHTGYLGKYPGLLEEAYYTLKEGKPLFLIGGFGGISKLIIDLRKGLEVKELTFEWQKEDKNNYQKDIEDLRNKNKALEEAIALSTEALMKQKMEIATLVEKINIVSGGSDGVVLTKDDLTRIALMETNTFKNKEEIEKLSKLISSSNNPKPNVSYREDINISNKNANVFDEKDLPIFVVYKINSDKTFYIKNRANNKLYEHVIGIRNLISNRYEVLDVDLENGLVIFKDQKNGTSLSLRVNE